MAARLVFSLLSEAALAFQLFSIVVPIEGGHMIRALVAITVRQHGSGAGSSSTKRVDDSDEPGGSSSRIVKKGGYPTASSSSTLSSALEKRRDPDDNGVRSVRKSISAFVLGGKLCIGSM